jgi:AraC-like DNA-binding protein
MYIQATVTKMLYDFDAAAGRRIIEGTPNIMVKPVRHYERTLEDHDIFYMLEGFWSVLLEKEEIRIKPGDIAVLPAAIMHSGLELCKANTRTIFVHFAKERLDHKAGVVEKISGEYFTVASLCHDNGNVLALFQNLTKTFHSNIPHRELRCSSILKLILAELEDIHQGEIVKRDSDILKLLEFIVAYPEKFFTIEELAGEAGLSGRSLTRRFKTETGKSVHQYQMDHKLDRIANLLKTRSHIGLKNLALNFGFYDEFHLSRSFKKKFGISPDRLGKADEVPHQ